MTKKLSNADFICQNKIKRNTELHTATRKSGENGEYLSKQYA